MHEQAPAATAALPATPSRYELGCLYIGVNDVRSFEWSAERFERDYRTALGVLAERCERVLAVTAPLDLGRPRAGDKVRDLNSVIELVAAEHDALLLDLRDFGARNLVMSDHVHPTALGQIAIAERALNVLARDGMTVAARPSTLIRPRITRWRKLRGDCSYTYRHLKVSLRAAVVTVYFKLRPPRTAR